jgi:hypothetical protein
MLEAFQIAIKTRGGHHADRHLSPGERMPMFGPLLPIAGAKLLMLFDSALATVIAAKSMTKPCGHEIRVVHIPSGEVTFRKT